MLWLGSLTRKPEGAVNLFPFLNAVRSISKTVSLCLWYWLANPTGPGSLVKQDCLLCSWGQLCPSPSQVEYYQVSQPLPGVLPALPADGVGSHNLPRVGQTRLQSLKNSSFEDLNQPNLHPSEFLVRLCYLLVLQMSKALLGTTTWAQQIGTHTAKIQGLVVASPLTSILSMNSF